MILIWASLLSFAYLAGCRIIGGRSHVRGDGNILNQIKNLTDEYKVGMLYSG